MCTIFIIFAQNFVNCAMNSIPSFNSYIENSIIKNWNLDALTDYKGATLQYHDIARKIEKLHILFENSDVKKGDKIAVDGKLRFSQWEKEGQRRTKLEVIVEDIELIYHRKDQ